MDVSTSLIGAGALAAFGGTVFWGVAYAGMNRVYSSNRTASLMRLQNKKGGEEKQAKGPIKTQAFISLVRAKFGQSEQKRDSFSYALIECTDGLCDALGSGKSLAQALAELDPSKDKTLRSLLESMQSRVAYGESPGRVFREVSAVSESPAFKTLGTAISVHYGAGGNLRELLSEFSAQQREGLLFRQNLKTQTAQGRLSVKLVGFVPPILLVAMSIFMPGYLDVFFSSHVGRLMLFSALALDVIGFLLVYRLMKVPV